MSKKTKRVKPGRKEKKAQRPSEPTPPAPPKPSGDSNSELLDLALQAAVPIWIDRFKAVPLESVLNRKRLEELGDVIGERGDVIMYKSKKKGQSGDAFNKLAEALARLAHAQGGVLFNGVRYEAERQP